MSLEVQPTDPGYSDYIVFVDESGDHSLGSIDPSYPMFVLALCVFRKQDYIDSVCPAVQRFKFKYWGHDSVVLRHTEMQVPTQQQGGDSRRGTKKLPLKCEGPPGNPRSPAPTRNFQSNLKPG